MVKVVQVEAAVVQTIVMLQLLVLSIQVVAVVEEMVVMHLTAL